MGCFIEMSKLLPTLAGFLGVTLSGKMISTRLSRFRRNHRLVKSHSSKRSFSESSAASSRANTRSFFRRDLSLANPNLAIPIIHTTSNLQRKEPPYKSRVQAKRSSACPANRRLIDPLHSEESKMRQG